MAPAVPRRDQPALKRHHGPRGFIQWLSRKTGGTGLGPVPVPSPPQHIQAPQPRLGRRRIRPKFRHAAPQRDGVLVGIVPAGIVNGPGGLQQRLGLPRVVAERLT